MRFAKQLLPPKPILRIAMTEMSQVVVLEPNPDGAGTVAWVYGPKAEDNTAWAEGWLTPNPSEEWWKTRPEQWRLMGLSLTTR